MTAPSHPPIDRAALQGLADRPLDWSYKGTPPSWWAQTAAQIVAQAPDLFEAGPPGPVCVLRADALTHNITAMAEWCRHSGVELAPHGKTHMAPQLAARQLAAGACAITVATVSQAAVYRAFGVRDLILANELVDVTGLRWVAAQLARDPGMSFVCWVDSVRGVELMTAALAGAARPVDVCVEFGLPGGRTGCRSRDTADEVARAAAASPQLRLVGVAGYEAARGHEVSDAALTEISGYLRELRLAVTRLAPLFETDTVLVSAGGSTYFDTVAAELTGWPGNVAVRTVLRSGCYLTHDHGLYARTSPLTRDGGPGLRPAFRVHAQAVSRPEHDLAILAMGRRDVAFDQDLPVALDLPGAVVTRLNDQHGYLSLGPDEPPQVGTWLQFGISHPCTVFDKWRLIPVLDGDDRVVDLIHTFF